MADRPTLYEDMMAVEKLIGAAIGRAADIETLTRVNASLIGSTTKRAIRNGKLLERICDKLGIGYSDLDPGRIHVPDSVEAVEQAKEKIEEEDKRH